MIAQTPAHHAVGLWNGFSAVLDSLRPLAALVIDGVRRWSVDCLWVKPWSLRQSSPKDMPTKTIR
jgi:hypothetical protein